MKGENMAPKIDPTILKALLLDAADTSIASHGGSGFASTFKITSKDNDGEEKLFFVKQGKGKESQIMFAGKHLISYLSFSSEFHLKHLPQNRTKLPTHDNINQENTRP
jgi:hypothetical protein